jgi:NAD(P)-dependent dehydrogenase (short-subunit alcohol dehydrogenase family)
VADATRADANDTAERLISASSGEQSVKTSKEGKVAVVTDAAAGIGQAVAVRLAEDGARVALLDVGDAEATVALVDAIGREPLPLRCDVTDEGSSIVPGCAPRAAAESSTCPRPP